ncbi:MAG: DNA polymerase III subunit gamma/tau [Desulfobacterales bacterium]|nr:DNA polymerase III subunit gamma/tau [Desulfobacterales bacterium]
MSYLVLARKYRPQTFGDVVRQEHVTRTLANAISHGRVAHAILFSGPRGTGKTTVARILAKAMNCKEGPTAIPCNVCRSCIDITAGCASDVFEIDGASNNSVDQIRELRENIRYMPVHSPHKIYILDEVHMLSIAAFNALLKTLEEPPAHVMFFFATTEPHKIPITILSRCQRHDFRRIDMTAIIDHLQGLCLREGVEMSAESLDLIAREAGGSMRDALSLLDQVLSGSQDASGPERVLEILGGIDRRTLFDLSEGLLGGDLPALLEILDQAYDRGVDMKKLFAELVAHFRNLVVLRTGAGAEKLVDAPPQEIERMRAQIQNLSTVHVEQLFSQIFGQESAVRMSVQPKLAMEMVILKACQLRPALSIDTLIEKLDQLRTEISGMPPDADLTPVQPATRPEPMPVASPVAPRPAEEAAPPPSATQAPPGGHSHDPDSVWRALFRKLSDTAPSMAASLRDATVSRIDGKGLEIRVAGNGFAVNMARRPKTLEVLRQVCQEHFGRPMAVTVTGSEEVVESPMAKRGRANQKKQEALGHPLVEDALEVFEGKLVDVKIL